MSEFKYVPVEPTNEMLCAAFNALSDLFTDDAHAVYKAMLAAAPDQPSPAESISWTLNLQQVLMLAEELVIGSQTIGASEHEPVHGDLLSLEVRPAGTVVDDDGKFNERPILAFSLAEYPDEGVYPIDPTECRPAPLPTPPAELDREAIRNAALDEAAGAIGGTGMTSVRAANTIRALKSQPAQPVAKSCPECKGAGTVPCFAENSNDMEKMMCGTCGGDGELCADDDQPAQPPQEDDKIALDRLADHIADNWPDRKFGLDEICQRLHAMWPAEFMPASALTAQPCDTEPTNTGHGHVFPRADGVRARCGGPGVCSECSTDAARKAAMQAREGL